MTFSCSSESEKFANRSVSLNDYRESEKSSNSSMSVSQSFNDYKHDFKRAQCRLNKKLGNDYKFIMTDPIQYGRNYYDRSNFDNFLKQNDDKDLKGKPVDRTKIQKVSNEKIKDCKKVIIFVA